MRQRDADHGAAIAAYETRETVAGGRAALPSARAICTRPTPLRVRPMCCAAACDRSMLRPLTKGPRSLIRTTTARPLETLVTLTREPIGSEREAAVSSLGLNTSPLLVRRPLSSAPYHDAVTTWDRGAAVNGAVGGAVEGGERIIVEHPVSNRLAMRAHRVIRLASATDTCCVLRTHAGVLHPCSIQKPRPMPNLYRASAIWQRFNRNDRAYPCVGNPDDPEGTITASKRTTIRSRSTPTTAGLHSLAC